MLCALQNLYLSKWNRTRAMDNTAVISIGSNIDAALNISRMLQILEVNLRIIRLSGFRQTSPVGVTNQPDFTNGAVKVETKMKLEDLKLFLKSVEDQLGRDRSQARFGPRTMDLDIIVWNGKIIDNDYYTHDFVRQFVDEILIE